MVAGSAFWREGERREVGRWRAGLGVETGPKRRAVVGAGMVAIQCLDFVLSHWYLCSHKRLVIIF